MKARLHPTAVVDPTATLEGDAEAGPHVVIGPDVRVGTGTRLLGGTVIQGPTALGSCNVVGPTASLGSDPQDLKYGGEPTRLTVGDGNRIREYVTINRGTAGGGGETVVGNDCLLMAYSHVAHDCRVGSGVVMANAATLGGHVTVGDASVVGAFTAVHPFCRVGEHSYVGGFCVITRDVPPFLRVMGQRDEARTLGVNSVGLARRGFSEETINRIKRAYRIFRRKGRLDRILEEIEAEFDDVPELARLVSFCRDSQRGVIR